jgi:poly(3-hydroxybutyrate) depolymerase
MISRASADQGRPQWPPAWRRSQRYLLAKDVGHYSIFNGSKWRNHLAPVLERFLATHRARETLTAVA